MQQRMKNEMLASVLVALLLSGCARQPPFSFPPVPAVEEKTSLSLNLRGRAMMGSSSQQARN